MAIKTRTEGTCIDMKSVENRECASCSSGVHDFENAILNQDPSSTNILLIARRVPSEMKIMKISWTVDLGRPGGMRGGAGRRYEEGQRSANLI